jgi:transposase
VDNQAASHELTTAQAAPPCKPAYRRLTNADRAYILKLRDQKLTQAEIAQRIGCSQQSVSEWLRQCQDTSAQASQYLRGSALSMARKIVTKGRPSDLVATLKGINVLEEQQQQSFTLAINGVVLHGIGSSPKQQYAVGLICSLMLTDLSA